MIGGDVYAHTIIGVEIDEDESTRFLILDPHFTGSDLNTKLIIQKQWCAWRDPKVFFKQNVFYNMCLPGK
jgi:hypothetical protein